MYFSGSCHHKGGVERKMSVPEEGSQVTTSRHHTSIELSPIEVTPLPPTKTNEGNMKQ